MQRDDDDDDDDGKFIEDSFLKQAKAFLMGNDPSIFFGKASHVLVPRRNGLFIFPKDFTRKAEYLIGFLKTEKQILYCS